VDVSVFEKYEFFCGVPDSQLKPLCDWLQGRFKEQPHRHIIAANEGNAAALAAGYHLATGKVAVCYLQNSGIGNIVNPVASLLSNKVYGIPVLFVVGWRGEPGVKDEPQHSFQGEITLKLLKDLDISTYVINSETTEEEFRQKTTEFDDLFAKGESAAIVVRKNALSFSGETAKTLSNATLLREDILKRIVAASDDDIIVTTTGKTSRELFEIRQQMGYGHDRDFLTIGSMGHASSIALGVALQKPDKRIWVIDGDGAAIMHMGAMATMGKACPNNIIHVVINNCSHESVGGMPTAGDSINFVGLAAGLGYPIAKSVSSFDELDAALTNITNGRKLSFLEVKSAPGSRDDLGRPDVLPFDNKKQFMGYLDVTKVY